MAIWQSCKEINLQKLYTKPFKNSTDAHMHLYYDHSFKLQILSIAYYEQSTGT